MQHRNPVSLIFCERSGRWAAAWRIAWRRRPTRGETSAEIRLLETRSPSECLEAVAAAPAAFVVLELTAADCDRTLELLFEISSRHRQAATAVAAERSMNAYQWLARELGAVHFLASPRELAPLADICERFAEQSAWRFAEQSAWRRPAAELDFERSVWASLPWGKS